MNLEGLIRRVGIERVGFHTMTFVENLTDRVEAQRRFNSYTTGFLRGRVTDYIASVERQDRGAIHYHLAVAFPFDIRTGFNFEAARRAAACRRSGDVEGRRAAERIYFASANDSLRGFWADVRREAPVYGFGRCETLPVLSCSAAVARYLGAYVTSEWRERLPEDKGMRAVRYGLRERVASIRWSWLGGSAATWRKGCALLSALIGEPLAADWGLDKRGRFERVSEGVLGTRWGWHWRREIEALGRNFDLVRQKMAELSFRPSGTLPERVAEASRICGLLLEAEARKGGA